MFCTDPHTALHKIVCYVCICMCMRVLCVCPSTHVEDRGQLAGVASLLPHGSLGSSSGCQAVTHWAISPTSIRALYVQFDTFLSKHFDFFFKKFFLFYVHKCFACIYICVALNLWSCSLLLPNVEIRSMDLELFLIGHIFFREFVIALGKRSDTVDLAACV